MKSVKVSVPDENTLKKFASFAIPVRRQLINAIEEEMQLKYEMPPELRAKFSKTQVVTFDVDEEHKMVIRQNLRSKVVLEKSLEQHAAMCVDNSEELQDAKRLAKELDEDIECRVKRFSKCLSQCSKNYREWLVEDYKMKLTVLIGKKYREKIMNEAD